MEKNKSIIILSSHASLNYLLINRLAKEFSVSYVIYENQSFGKKLKLLKRRIRKLGIGKVFGQILFHLFDKIYIKRISRKKVEELIEGEDCEIPNVPSLDVENINSKKLRNLIQAHNDINSNKNIFVLGIKLNEYAIGSLDLDEFSLCDSLQDRKVNIKLINDGINVVKAEAI